MKKSESTETKIILVNNHFLNMLACFLDIDLLNFDENGFFFVDNSSSKTQANTANNNHIQNIQNQNEQNYSYSSDRLTITTPTDDSVATATSSFGSNIGDSSALLCKFCYNPLAIYLINFDQALKICPNQNVIFQTSLGKLYFLFLMH